MASAMDTFYSLTIFALCCAVGRTSPVVCGTTRFTARENFELFQSPGYPSNYPPNIACEYVITAAKYSFIEIAFKDFQLQNKSGDERSDYLQMTGVSGKGQYLEGTLSTPTAYRSKKNELRLRFVSDAAISSVGFSAEYRSIPNQKRCQKKSYKELEGTVVIKGNEVCEHIIKAPAGYHVKIEITKFMSRSDRDFMQILDGRDGNRQQEEYYRWTRHTTSHFVSKTNRVMINSFGLFVVAEATFKAEKIISCGVEPFYVLNGEVDCTYNADTGLAETCRVTSCNENYVLGGNRKIACNKLTEKNMPKCVVDPALLETCERNMTDPLCPFSPEWLAEYYTNNVDATLEELDSSEELDLASWDIPDFPEGSVGRSSGRGSSKCGKKVCGRHSSGRYQTSCVSFTGSMRRRHNRHDQPFIKWCYGYCYGCRNVGCGGSCLFC